MAKSPSAWHDDARNRDAGHDEMQVQCLRYWQKTIKDNDFAIYRRPPYSNERLQYRPVWVAAEEPLVCRDVILGFADVMLGFDSVEPDDARTQREERNAAWKREEEYEPQSFYMIFEVKPVIHSVGAVVRQLRALGTIAKRCGLHSDVAAWVYDDDPKYALLVEMASGFFIHAVGRDQTDPAMDGRS